MHFASLATAFPSFEQPPQDGGRLAEDSIVREVNRHLVPVTIGASSAFVTVLGLDEIAPAMQTQLQANICAGLVHAQVIGAFGDHRQVVAQRRQMLAVYEQVLRANGSENRRTARRYTQIVYIVLQYHILAAYGSLRRGLSGTECDLYCNSAADSIGYSLGIEGEVPRTYMELYDHYDRLINRLRPSPEAHAVMKSQQALMLGNFSMWELFELSSWLVPNNFASELGIPQPDETETIRLLQAAEPVLLPW